MNRFLVLVLSTGVAWTVSGVLTVRSCQAETLATSPDWPTRWMEAWREPPAELRPLQIVHGVPAELATLEGMKHLAALGLGGIVTNVDFVEYMRSEKHWKKLIQAVEACEKLGLVVWLYDEDGYPSGSAGGLVLKTDPGFEALALTYDPSRAEPFALRPAYEHTHASNNFYAARRYPNLMDSAAVACFIEKTHEAYWHRLQPYFGKTIRAVFTDEPSLMAVNLGQLSDSVRKKVRVVDPLNPDIAPLPSVPWTADLPAIYAKRYRQKLDDVRRSLFVGDDEADRKVRQRFWALIAELTADRYFGAIQRWCHAHHIASSGHSLWEETPIHHVPLEGNALAVLSRMDIPGLDVLSSDPTTVLQTGWLTAGLPASAAMRNGGRRVMTEVSDFIQTMGGKKPASVEAMQVTAAWQAAFGVTEFMLYYNRHQRKTEEYGAYCRFVGRLNTLLREARPMPRVLLYYPIHDLWAEYKPVAEKLTLESQSERAQRIQNSFLQIGRLLVRNQIPFALIDHESLAGASVAGGTLNVYGRHFDTLILPDTVTLPKEAADVMRRFKTRSTHSQGGRILTGTSDAESWASSRSAGRLRPQCEHVVLGRFVRDRRDILLLANVGKQPYQGKITIRNEGSWWAANPGSGNIEPVRVDEPGWATVSLPGRSALLLIGSPRRDASGDPDTANRAPG